MTFFQHIKGRLRTEQLLKHKALLINSALITVSTPKIPNKAMRAR